MNFCTKCASYYQVAGTCNCFAQAQPLPFIPWNQPVTPPWWIQPTTTTTTTWKAGDPVTYVDQKHCGTDQWSFTVQPNDPKAQRVISEMVQKHTRRQG